MDYREIKGAPAYLGELGLKAIYVPRQDGWRAHVALWDVASESEVFATNTLESLAREAESRREKAGIKS